MKDLNETKTQNKMKTIINTLKNDKEAALKMAASLAGLAVTAFSVFIIVTRLI